VLQPSAHRDETVPNQANEALARGLGLAPVNLSGGGTVDLAYWASPPPALTPPVAGNLMSGGQAVTAAFIQLDPATHGMLTTQHGQRRHDVSQPPPYPKIDPPQPVDNPTVRLQAIYLKFVQDYFAGAVPQVIDGQ
jgi:hypothetical protein